MLVFYHENPGNLKSNVNDKTISFVSTKRKFSEKNVFER